jgi:excisionase family DNA binding protein
MALDKHVLTAKEAAELLSVHVETIRRLARAGDIPAFKMGKDWRFRRVSLLQWADTHHMRRLEPAVLVVDDDEGVRELARQFLEAEGCRVATAPDGESGLRRVAQGVPDLVLLDLKMPRMSGAEFLKRLREEGPDVPVIVITGYPDSNVMREAMRYGPITLVAKPLAREQLLRAVRTTLAGSLPDPGNGQS